MTKRQTKQRKNKLNDEKRRKLLYDRNDDGNATKELDATQ